MDAAKGLLRHGPLRIHNPGNAKVSHLHAAIPQHHDVLGLDIPVNDAPAVGVLQGLQNLVHEMQTFPPVQRTAPPAHILLERNPLNQLHDHIFHALGLAHIKDVDDVGVTHHPHGLRFVVEPAANLIVLRKLRFQNLHRDHAVEPVAFGFVDNSHTPHAQHIQNFIAVIQRFSYVAIIHRTFSLLNASALGQLLK